MYSHWPHLAKFWNEYIPKDNAVTITFDNNTHYCKSNKLENDIDYHGGGTTNIIGAFEAFEKELEKCSPDEGLTVIFASDGQDNNISTLE